MNTDRFKFRVWDGEKYARLCLLDCIADKENNALRMVAIKPGSVIEQCTGIKDQSGKLIFEGDVVDYYDPMADDHYQGVVTFDDSETTASGYYIKGNRKGRWDSYLDGSHCRIIGNVHQMEDFGNEKN